MYTHLITAHMHTMKLKTVTHGVLTVLELKLMDIITVANQFFPERRNTKLAVWKER